MAGDVLVRPVVHERDGEQRRGRRARRKVRDGGGHEVAAPGVLDRHAQPKSDREIAHQLGARQAADLGDLQVERLERALASYARSSDCTSAMHSSSTIGSVVALADDEALLHRRARLLEEDALERLDRARGDDGVLDAPAAVRVGDDDVLRPGRGDDAARPLGVLVRVGADLQLEAMDALVASRLHVRRHLLRPSRAAPRSRAGSGRAGGRRAGRRPDARQNARARPSTRCRSRSSRTRDPSARRPSPR